MQQWGRDLEETVAARTGFGQKLSCGVKTCPPGLGQAPCVGDTRSSLHQGRAPSVQSTASRGPHLGGVCVCMLACESTALWFSVVLLMKTQPLECEGKSILGPQEL